MLLLAREFTNYGHALLSLWSLKVGKILMRLDQYEEKLTLKNKKINK